MIRRDQHHIFESAGHRESCILFLHIKFEISHHEVQGYVALMMDLPSIDQLRSLIAEFLKDGEPVCHAGRNDYNSDHRIAWGAARATSSVGST
jgi:hypothetical protein